MSLLETREMLAALVERIDNCDFTPESPALTVPMLGNGWVYIARAKGTPYVKIGYTGGEHPSERISQLQTASPHKLELIAAYGGSQQDESELHRALGAYRVRGEWFKLTGTDVAAIERCGWYGEKVVQCACCPAVIPDGEWWCWDCESVGARPLLDLVVLDGGAANDTAVPQ